MFQSKVATTRVKIGEKVRVYELNKPGDKLKLEHELQQFKAEGAFDIAPNMQARITIQVEHFVTGEPA